MSTNDIQRLISASQKERTSTFLGYRIAQSSLGAGGQGTVYLAENRIGKKYAIKFTRPDVCQPQRLRERVGKFFNELKILVGISHKNIIRVHSGGYCDITASDENLELIETIERPGSSEENFVYFYVMDYVPKSLADIFPVSSSSFDPKSPLAPTINSPEKQVVLFEKLVHDIAQAIDYCHERKLFHNDIKSENILYSEDDDTFLLADFGHAQRDPRSSEQDFIRNWAINHPHYKFGKKPKDNDLYGFSLILLNIVEALRDRYDLHRYEAIHKILTKATDTHIDSFPFNSGTDLRDALRRYLLRTTWSLKLHVGEYLVPSSGRRFLIDSKIRLPVSGSVFSTPEIRSIIDTPEFQRLRGVKQLGPTEFVFPGATHTRFEHSLGTYHLALRYLESLTRVPEFNECCYPQHDVIKYTALACLLHDIGHYPFSHWIEEIDEFPRGISFTSHERRAAEIIGRSEIGKLLEDDWGIELKSLFAIIGRGPLPQSLKIAKTVVDSVLDVDKLDYLNRDSVHCGVNYGSSLDIPRLLEALHVDRENERICLTHKAKTYVMSLVACRNMMYTDVYWHKTVRALTGMFKYFIFQAINQNILTKEFLDDVFMETDAVFIERMWRRVEEYKATTLLSLLKPFAYKGRYIYKPVFIFSKSHIDEREPIVEFFDQVFSCGYESLARLSTRLERKLSERHGTIKENDIIIEKTPAKEGNERYDIAKCRIWNTRRKEFENPPEKVKELNEFLGANRQAFILCSPSAYLTLRSFSLDEWQSIFESVNSE